MTTSEAGHEKSWPGRLWHDGPAVFYVVLVFVIASIPVAAPVSVPLLSVDKVQHLLAFAGMHGLIYRALHYEGWFERWTSALLVSGAFSIVAGGFIELWQAALPYRSAEWGDFVADALGALLMTVCIATVRYFRGGQPKEARTT